MDGASAGGAPRGAGPGGDWVSLDVIDARNNAWSWFNLDSVRIPGVLVPQGSALTIQTWPDGTLRVSWPASATGSILEVSLDLPGIWEDAGWWGCFPATEGNENVIHLSPSETAQFFRLRRP